MALGASPYLLVLANSRVYAQFKKNNSNLSDRKGELIQSLKQEQSFLLITILVSKSESSMPWIFLY